MQFPYSGFTTTAALLLLSANTNAIAFGPAPTESSAIDGVFEWTPAPTKAPSVDVVAKKRAQQQQQQQRKRSVNSDYTVEDCGFIWDDFYESYSLTYCEVGLTCMLYTATDLDWGMQGCCNEFGTQNCNWHSACAPYDDIVSSVCDDDCMSNDFITKCTNSEYPLCATYEYESDYVYQYSCAYSTDSINSIKTIWRSSIEESVVTLGSASSESTIDDPYTSVVNIPTLSNRAVTGWQSSSPSNDEGTANIDNASPTGNTNESPSPSPNNDSSNDQSTDNENPQQQKPGDSKTPIATIIGIVIGILAFLFLLAGAILFFCLKKRKQRQLAESNAAFSHQQALTYYSHQPEMVAATSPQVQQQEPLMVGYGNSGTGATQQQQQQGMQGGMVSTNHVGYFAPQGGGESVAAGSPVSKEESPVERGDVGVGNGSVGTGADAGR